MQNHPTRTRQSAISIAARKFFIPSLLLVTMSLAVTVPVFYITSTPPGGNGTMDSVALWVAPDPNDSILFITDKTMHYLEMHDAVTNTYIGRIGGSGSGPGQLNYPNGVAVAYNVATGIGVKDIVLTVERDNHRVSCFALPGKTFLGDFGATNLVDPYGIGLYWKNGNQLQAWITETDGSTDKVLVFNVTASAQGLTGALDFSFPTQGSLESIAIDPVSQRALIADEAGNNVMVYDLNGNFIQRFGAGLFVSDPEGIAIYDAHNGTGYIIVSDQYASPTQYEVFDRQTYASLGNFSGTTDETDGITLTQAPLPNLPNGSFYAQNSDKDAHCYDWAAIANALGLQIVIIPNTLPAPAVKVTSPNGSEVWEIGSTHNITWTNTIFSDPVTIEYSADAGASWTILASGVANTGSYAWTINVAPTAQGRIRVSDAADADPGDVSDNNFTVTNLPAAPGNLTATANGLSTINLSWKDNSSNEDGFKIERKTSSSSFNEIAMVGAGMTTYSDVGLASNTAYTYQVRAFNANGNSSYSNTATATTGGTNTNLALNKPAGASGTNTIYVPARAVDGTTGTYWRSNTVSSGAPNANLDVNLKGSYSISRAVIKWNSSYYAKKYDFQVSSDSTNWTTVYTNNSGTSSTQDFTFAAVTAPYVRLLMRKNNKSNYRVTELEVYANVSSPSSPDGAAQHVETNEANIALQQAYPNPFNPSTSLRFHLPQETRVSLKVYNVIGSEVVTLINENRAAGLHAVVFNPAQQPSGVYFAVLQAGAIRQVQRLLLVK